MEKIKQKCTSANTSINSTRMPRVYNSFGIHGDILDYGCGRYTDHIEKAVHDAGYKWYGYDPYNRSDEENFCLVDCDVDYVFCSNVLNVIDSDDAMMEVISNLLLLGKKNNATVVITVYEGDKSMVGRVTKKDCYQRNQPLHYYLQFIGSEHYKTTVKNNHIIINGWKN